MLTYDLKTGYSCNNQCKHCVIEDSRDKLIELKSSIDLNTEDCLRQVDYAVAQGAEYIVLTGGEVTIRKDFPTLVDYCSLKGLNITIQTNGRRLHVPEVARAISTCSGIRCVVALHGACSDTHDGITQVVGSFNETCKGIRYAVQQGILTILKVVISKKNRSELSKIVKLANELGVRYVCFAFPHAQGGARKRFAEVVTTYSELHPDLDSLIGEAKAYHIQIEFEAIPFCIIPHDMQLVGELKYRFGNTLCTQVGEEPFDWAKVRKNIKSKAPQCSFCSMDSVCEGVWSEYIDAYGGSEFVPISIPEQMQKKLMTALDNRYAHFDGQEAKLTSF